MQYSIGEFSRLTNLSIHTLRYYEQEGLITPKRDSGNRRCYSDKDLEWIEFIKRLKATNMPLQEIQQYAKLRLAGDATQNARMELLQTHRQQLNAQIKTLQEHLQKLDEKILFYQQEICRKLK